MLAEYSFDDADLTWLAGQGFDLATLDAFARLRFTGDVWAIPEGHVVLPDESLIEVAATLPEAQLVETLVLDQITFQTALATKAAWCRIAARGRADDPVRVTPPTSPRRCAGDMNDHRARAPPSRRAELTQAADVLGIFAIAEGPPAACSLRRLIVSIILRSITKCTGSRSS